MRQNPGRSFNILILVMGLSEGGERIGRTQYLERKKNFPKLLRDTKPQIQEVL